MERFLRSRFGSAALVVYGVVTAVTGSLIFVSRPSVGQVFLGVLLVLIGLIAITGGVVWIREQRRVER